MSNQITGYYIPYKDKLLNDFDKTALLIKDWAIDQFGEEFALIAGTNIRKEYEILIPEIPYILGWRSGFLNSFLLITAQELAAYKALTKLGRSPEEVWTMCHKALRLRTTMIPFYKKWILRKFMFSGLVRKIFSIRVKQQLKPHSGDFQVEYLVGRGDDFDLGVNYLKCGHQSFAMKHGGEKFAPYICMSDIALSDAMGWGLIRTQSLADGCTYCDFRFKKGAATQISSKSPEVQNTIEKIHEKEIRTNVS
jgi:hypothetical protein